MLESGIEGGAVLSEPLISFPVVGDDFVYLVPEGVSVVGAVKVAAFVDDDVVNDKANGATGGATPEGALGARGSAGGSGRGNGSGGAGGGAGPGEFDGADGTGGGLEADGGHQVSAGAGICLDTTKRVRDLPLLVVIG
jgi:hypothetical protein